MMIVVSGRNHFPLYSQTSAILLLQNELGAISIRSFFQNLKNQATTKMKAIKAATKLDLRPAFCHFHSFNS